MAPVAAVKPDSNTFKGENTMNTHTKKFHLLCAGGLVALAGASVVAGCGQETQAAAETGEPLAQVAPVAATSAETVATKTKAKKPLDVNVVAGKPAAHIGKISVVGVVATSKAKEGFLLLDSVEYKKCAFTCLNEPGNKIPVRWSGASPKIKDTVLVEGTLVKTDKGFTFTAQKVSKPAS